jgi:hypothetical protein
VRTVLVALLAALIGATAVGQRAPAMPNPCVQPGVAPRLQPVDEASSKAEFLQYRTRLREAVARRDLDALVEAADPDIRLGFDASGGVSDLRKQFDGRSESWDRLAAVLALGGSFSSPTSFEAPYVYAEWPEQFDSFECAAVTGSNVRLRAAASLNAPVVASVGHAIVHVLAGNDDEVWSNVQLSDGRSGYMSRKFVRSPVDYRALFNLSKGRWRMTAFVAGD